MINKHILLLIVLLNVSCSENNPLLGAWQLKPGQKNAAFFPCKEVKFEESLSTCAGLAEKVSYEIRDGEVIVHGESGVSSIYKIKDKNTITVEIPYSGIISFNRSSY